MAERIYLVQDDESQSMVQTNSPGKALSHVVGEKYECRVATAMELADYIRQGGEVEYTDPQPEDGEEAEEEESPDEMAEEGEEEPEPEADEKEAEVL